jgi:hypothetical protein
LDDKDEQAEATLLQGYVDNAALTVNEVRDRLNMPRYAIQQANEPFLATPTGPAFLNPDVQPVGLPGNLPSVPGNHPGAPERPEQGALPPKKPQAAIEAPRDESVQGDKRAEQKAFLAYIRKSAKTGEWRRDFEFTAYPDDVAEAANRLAAAGDVDACKALFTMNDG